jgi:hypothetical protein
VLAPNSLLRAAVTTLALAAATAPPPPPPPPPNPLATEPAHRLLDIGRSDGEAKIIDVHRNVDAASTRRFEDYEVTVHHDRVPSGVELWRWDFSKGDLVRFQPAT